MGGELLGEVENRVEEDLNLPSSRQIEWIAQICLLLFLASGGRTREVCLPRGLGSETFEARRQYLRAGCQRAVGARCGACPRCEVWAAGAEDLPPRVREEPAGLYRERGCGCTRPVPRGAEDPRGGRRKDRPRLGRRKVEGLEKEARKGVGFWAAGAGRA